MHAVTSRPVHGAWGPVASSRGFTVCNIVVDGDRGRLLVPVAGWDALSGKDLGLTRGCSWSNELMAVWSPSTCPRCEKRIFAECSGSFYTHLHSTQVPRTDFSKRFTSFSLYFFFF